MKKVKVRCECIFPEFYSTEDQHNAAWIEAEEKLLTKARMTEAWKAAAE